MASRIARVAEAVATAINAATLPVAVTAQVAWMPFTDRIDAGALACWVVPSTETPANLGRRVAQYDCEILVALQKAADDEAEVGTLVAALEAINDALFQRALPLPGDPTPADAAFVSARLEPVLDPDHWNRLKQYTGVIRLIYRVFA